MILDDVLRYVMASDLRFAHAFFSDIYNHHQQLENTVDDALWQNSEEAELGPDLCSIGIFHGSSPVDWSISEVDVSGDDMSSTVPTSDSSYGVDDGVDDGGNFIVVFAAL